MGKLTFLLLVVVVVVSQAQSQSLSARPGPQQGQRRRPGTPRLTQGNIVRSASSGVRKSSSAKVNAKPKFQTNVKPNVQPNTKPNVKPKEKLNAKPSTKPSTRPGNKAQLRRPKLIPGKAKVSASKTTSGLPKTKCKGRCKFPTEVCVKRARCGGPSCFFCAETKSIPKLPEKKPKTSPAPSPMDFGFGGMGMNNLGMLGMQQQQPTDFFSDIFGLGPSSGGGFDMFGTGQSQMGVQPVSSGFPNRFFSTNPFTSIPVAGDPSFNPMDFSSLFTGSSEPSGGPNTNSASLLPGSSQAPSSTAPSSPTLHTYNSMLERPTMDTAPGLASLL